MRGFLAGGMTAWRSEGRPVKRIEMIDPDGLADRLAAGDEIVVLDVRGGAEFAAGHIPGSVNIPYAQLLERLAELPREAGVATVCSGGKRSGLAASLLQREGFERVIHVGKGGVGSWQRSGHPVAAGPPL